MSIKIETEKIVERGIACRKILSTSGVRSSSEFPEEYQKNEPYISIQNNVLSVKKRGDWQEGTLLLETEFQEGLEHIRKAGERAHAIMEKARELQKTWNGHETFVI